MTSETDLALGYLAVLAGRAVEEATAPAASKLGVTKASMNLLYEVAIHAPVTTAALSRVLGVGPSAITPLTRSLEREGLVEQFCDDRDRRQRWWQLTEQGQDFLTRAAGEVKHDVDAVFAALTSAEAHTLTGLLGRVIAPWLVERLGRDEADQADEA